MNIIELAKWICNSLDDESCSFDEMVKILKEYKKEKEEKKMKADDKYIIEEEKPEKYTNFEYLMKKVEVLEEAISQIQYILNENDLHVIKKIRADDDLLDEVFNRLENEQE